MTYVHISFVTFLTLSKLSRGRGQDWIYSPIPILHFHLTPLFPGDRVNSNFLFLVQTSILLTGAIPTEPTGLGGCEGAVQVIIMNLSSSFNNPALQMKWNKKMVLLHAYCIRMDTQGRKGK